MIVLYCVLLVLSYFRAIYNSRETGITEAMLDHTKSQKKTNTEPVISTSTTSTVEKPPKRKPKGMIIYDNYIGPFCDTSFQHFLYFNLFLSPENLHI